MNKYVKRYFIDAMSGMAQGLFASLLIGTIIKTLGQQLTNLWQNPVFDFLVTAGNFATEAHVVGAAMAVGIGFAMGAPALVLFSLVAVGAAANVSGGAGGPLAVLVIAILAAEAGNLVSKKTKVDIIVTPFVTIIVGALLTVLTAKYIGKAASSVGSLVVWATTLRPFIMGIIVSVIIGIALTLPISSAAICAALGLTGLAGGAAVAGCCAQMVGFAVGRHSFPRTWNFNATNAKYHKKSTSMDTTNSNFCNNRPPCNLSFQTRNERSRSFFRHGNLRTCRTNWRNNRMVRTVRSRSCQRSRSNLSKLYGLAWTNFNLLCSTSSSNLGFWSNF